MTTIDDSTAVALWTTTFLLLVVLYVWTALALAAVFRKSGEEPWKAWVPILNLVVLLQLGGLSGWLLLLVLVPFAGPLILWALLIVACYRVNLSFGHGIGMTVLAALLMPVWASILGFGPARWVGAERGAGAVAGPRRTAFLDAEPEYVPRSTPPAYTPSAPLPTDSTGEWAPPPAPPLPPLAASARARAAGYPTPEGTQGDPSDASESPFPRRSTLEPQRAPENGRWGGFDLGAVTEITSEVTGADSAPSAPISAAPVRAVTEDSPLGMRREPPITAAPPVTREQAPDASPFLPPPAPPPPVEREPEPWAPARSPMPEGDAFPDTSGQVSAVVGSPDAGTPRSARGAVSAQYAMAEVPEDPMDATIITRRRRTPWSLIPPSGAPIPVTAETVLVGRKPAPDPAFPGAQLVSIDDGTVSKTHARLVLRDDHWYVTDLGSTNGVLFATLMGTEVEAAPGDEVEAGERFFLGDAEVRLQRSDG